MNVEIEDVLVVKETERAVLIKLDEGRGDQFWIPKSEIKDDSDAMEEGDVGTLVISEWLAEQKGLS
jgi:hypothetical protein